MRAFAVLLMLGASVTQADDRTAITQALAYHAQLSPERQATTRYVWMQPELSDEDTPRVVNLAMNFAMTAVGNGAINLGVPVSDEVLAYDLADFDPFTPDRLVQIWDSMALDDSVFHLPKELQEGGPPIAILAPHLATHVVTSVSGESQERIDVLLTKLSSSPAPILEARFLVEQIMDQRYYQCRDLKVGDDLGEVLSRSGYYFKTSKDTNGLRALWMMRSQITGDQRVIATLFGTANRTAASLTYDQFDGTDDPELQFIRNLDRFNLVENGSEVFIPQQNGTIEFLLVDGEKKLVDAAPDNLASDHTKPPGHDSILRPGLSCVSCHTTGDGEGMYRQAKNQFGNLPLPGLTPEQRAVLRTTFSEELDTADGIIGRARRDFTAAVLPIVGAEEGAVNRVGQAMATMVHDYRYGMIDAEQAQRELGVTQPLGVLVKLETNSPIDPEAYLVINGEPVSRQAFNTVRPQLAAMLSQSETE